MSAPLELSPEQRAERARKQSRDWARRHKDEANARRRARYRASPALRAAIDQRQRRRRADAATRARDSERASRRHWSARLRASRWGFAAFHHLRTLTLGQLAHPSFLVRSPGRKLLVEQWPIKDEAARWLAAHDPPPDTKKARCPFSPGHPPETPV